MTCTQLLPPSLPSSDYFNTFIIQASFDDRPVKRQRTSSFTFDLEEMSQHFFHPPTASNDQDFDFDESFHIPPGSFGDPLTAFPSQQLEQLADHPQLYHDSTPIYFPPQQFQPHVYEAAPPLQQWIQNPTATMDQFLPESLAFMPDYTDDIDFSQEIAQLNSAQVSRSYLSPESSNRTRASRATSVADSVASSAQSFQTDRSRGVSPNVSEMARWGYDNEDGSWSCAYPGCSSKSRFSRGCDLRKHFKRHTKTLFCRHTGCAQATEGGFSSKKDRARHEAKHDPNVVCEWDGCRRLFSRHDNMKDHVRRVHKRRVESSID